MVAGITEHCWTIQEFLSFHVPPQSWIPLTINFHLLCEDSVGGKLSSGTEFKAPMSHAVPWGGRCRQSQLQIQSRIDRLPLSMQDFQDQVVVAGGKIRYNPCGAGADDRVRPFGKVRSRRSEEVVVAVDAA